MFESFALLLVNFEIGGLNFFYFIKFDFHFLGLVERLGIKPGVSYNLSGYFCVV